MKKILYVYGGPDFHPTRAAGEVFTELAKRDGRFTVEMKEGPAAFQDLRTAGYDGVVVYTTFYEHDLTPDLEQSLMVFIENGGGFVGVHSAADSFRGSRAYVEMLGGEFLTHPPFGTYKVSVIDREHYITARMRDYVIEDEMYHLQSFDPEKVNLLADTPWQDRRMPMAWTKQRGKGRVAYLANGHDLRAWRNPEFQKLLVRAAAWSTGEEKPARTVRCGLLGYGPAFNMGAGHARWLNSIEGLETVAACDRDPARMEAAKIELPGLKGYFTDLDQMLKLDDLDLVVNILPHNLHAPMTLKCLDAGKHVVIEKPFCITTDEANAMISLARRKGVMLSLFHNRRWDSDYLAIRDVINRGLIGEVFHVEARTGHYEHPGFWWRSDKALSGGVMYDWGAHFLDWILNIVPGKIGHVMGDFQKRMWYAITNEDHGQVFVRFDSGATADFQLSTIAASVGPKWRILGTLGSIEAHSHTELNVVSYASGLRMESKVAVGSGGEAWEQYYRNVADHLLYGEELFVTAEQARRVIAVIEAGEKSSKEGRSVPVADGCE